MDTTVKTAKHDDRELQSASREDVPSLTEPSVSSPSSNQEGAYSGKDTAVRLSEAQQVVLARASGNEDGQLIWPSKGGPVGASAPNDGFGSTLNDRRCIEALYRKGMICGDVDDLFSLKLTAKAFVALQIDPVEWPDRLRGTEDNVSSVVEDLDFPVIDASSASKNEVTIPSASSPLTQSMRAGSKGAALIELLACDGGATLDELQQASGWQAHSVRGFLSETVRRKLGGQLALGKNADGQTTWRLVDTGARPKVEAEAEPTAPVTGIDEAQS
ncbi:MAG: DUF3489 domain-containing protein [Pseudomonadota bacterium]